MRTDCKHMASALAQYGINTLAEAVQNVHRYERLDSAGKATAMDAISAPSTQVQLAQGKRQRYILMLPVTGGDHILQIHVGRIAAFLNKTEEGVKISVFQGRHLLRHPGVFFIEMVGPQHCPITELLPKLLDNLLALEK